jgi:hypothetical protein
MVYNSTGNEREKDISTLSLSSARFFELLYCCSVKSSDCFFCADAVITSNLSKSAPKSNGGLLVHLDRRNGYNCGLTEEAAAQPAARAGQAELPIIVVRAALGGVLHRSRKHKQ